MLSSQTGVEEAQGVLTASLGVEKVIYSTEKGTQAPFHSHYKAMPSRNMLSGSTIKPC